VIRLESRNSSSHWLAVLAPVAAALFAMLLAAIPLMAAGQNPITAYGLMFKGAFGGMFAFTETLTRATPLILTGLAAAVAFRAKLWNIGLEGQFYLGAVGAVIVGSGSIDAPAAVLIPMTMAGGALFGALAMLGPAWLKTRYQTDEVVTTLLLNFVILLLVQMLLEGALKDPMALGWPQSAPIVDNALLPALSAKYRLHTGLYIALCASLLVFALMRYTTFGFALRAVGENPSAARHAGISVSAATLGAAALSGALAGLAGVGEVAGLKGYLTADISPGFGYAGIVVAMLAGLSPLGVVMAAVFVAAVFVGADSMSRALSVSSYLADLMVALALLCVLIGGFLMRFKVTWVSNSRRTSSTGAEV